MLYTRSKIKKTQRISQASVKDTDGQAAHPGDLVGSNDDLLIEILLRIPVKSIIRFKYVSKHWRRLLSDRSFTIRFDRLSKSPGIFFRNEYVPFDVEDRSPHHFRTLDFCNDPYGITIVQSCNGLLICSSDYSGDDCIYYVFNPATKQFAVIPMIYGGKEAQKTIQLMALAFHPTEGVHYKLVCIRRLNVSPTWNYIQIQIYSSDTRKWKISIDHFFSLDVHTFTEGVYWNGVTHLSSYSYCTLSYFEISSEQLKTLPFPEGMKNRITKTEYFGESRGHLHLIDNDLGSFAMNVYELLSDHSGWLVKYRVDLYGLTYAFREMIDMDHISRHRSFKVIDGVRGEKEEDTFMVLTIPGKLITYNINDESFKQIFNHDKYHKFYGYPYFHWYTETLASL